MKWKMAPNSLFAVLLRSPWWISIAIVFAIALASRTLLPEKYFVFGIMGSLPFLVISMVTAFHQFQAPNAVQVERTLLNVSAMAWRDFCGALEQAYRQQGYHVDKMDGKAADLLLTKAGRRTLVAAKRWKAGNHGVEPLRALAQAREAQDTSHCVYVSLTDVGEKSGRFAVANKIELLSGATLAQLLRGTAAAKK